MSINLLKYLLLGIVLGACSADEKDKSPAFESTVASEDTKPSESQPEEKNQEESKDDAKPSEEPIVNSLTKNCKPPVGVDNAPETIEAFVTFLNALPKPTNLLCVVSALKRPLKIKATKSTVSAQPSSGPLSPRIFIQYGRLKISVVPEGKSSEAIELGETLATNAQASIKGDLAVPINEKLDAAAPYRGIYSQGKMACAGICHVTNIEEVKNWGNDVVSYASGILPIQPHLEKPLLDLRILRDDCESVDIPLCDFYRALFDHGKVEEF